MSIEQNLEIDRNLIAFQSVLATYLDHHRGAFAILRHQQVIDVQTCLSDAIEKAHSDFSDGVFSIQEITDQPVDLGFYSHAND